MQNAARGIDKPELPLFDHLTPEERLTKLSPLIDLLVEAIVRDALDVEASSPVEPRKLHALTHRQENTMAKARKQKTKQRSIKPWTTADLKLLRKQAGRTSAAKIAKTLKRSEGAVRQKAGSLGLSLRLR